MSETLAPRLELRSYEAALQDGRLEEHWGIGRDDRPNRPTDPNPQGVSSDDGLGASTQRPTSSSDVGRCLAMTAGHRGYVRPGHR